MVGNIIVKLLKLTSITRMLRELEIKKKNARKSHFGHSEPVLGHFKLFFKIFPTEFFQK